MVKAAIDDVDALVDKELGSASAMTELSIFEEIGCA